MWHYLMFSSINDSAVQLGSAAGMALLSPPPPPPSRRPTHVGARGPLLKKSNVRCYPSGSAAPPGAKRPPDGKTPLPKPSAAIVSIPPKAETQTLLNSNIQFKKG